MQISSRRLSSFIMDPLRRHPRYLALREQGIEARGGTRHWVGLEEIASKPSLRKGILSWTLELDLGKEAQLSLPAIPAAEGQAFAKTVAQEWERFNLDALAAAEPEVQRLLAALERLSKPKGYPAACLVNDFAKDAARLTSQVLSKLNPDALGIEATKRIAPIMAFASDPKQIRDAAIAEFVTTQLLRWEDFFDTVESMPLTPEQRLSIVVDEDATLVLAGAGSGKTSVITAKAAYLVKAGIRKPEELLLLAFAKDAATEMSERIELRCGVPVAARTFHALAYEIIGQVEGEKPPLAPTATDDKAFLTLIKEILRHIVATAGDIANTIIGWFAGFFDDFPSPWDFKSKHDWYAAVESRNLRTLQGETVNSFEELMIANWLYRNGVAYEYEPTYEHKLEKTGRRVYTPDFKLSESGVYLEHFGVRKKRRADGEEELVTAPFVDREEYLAGMDWKRQVHAEHETVLIETYSWEREDGRLLEALSEKLAPYITPRPIPDLQIYDQVAQIGVVDNFTSLMSTFLRHFKNGGYRVEDCEGRAETMKMGTRAEAFLKIFAAVYREYQERLGDRIDFEDMVNRATRLVESGRFDSPFRHILVDEFQDISTGRAKLIQALKRQHGDARVFAVGDDWQSIYRFAGSDIHIMRNFGREFGGTFAGNEGVHRTVDLGRTFRSLDKIALAAREFVLRNPTQLTKTVIPAGETDQPSIKIAWTRRETGEAVLNETLASLSATEGKNGGRPSILILGRYRFLEPDVRALQRRHSAADISFKTIHASKGLEADHVVILGADNARMGFPSMIVDDPLLGLVSPEPEPYPHAEERRVMYVAMTRARRSVNILSSEARPSTFVQELLTDEEFGAVSPSQAEDKTHVCPECSGRLLYMPKQNGPGWYRCEHVKLCGTTMPSCPACGVGLPVKDSKSDEMKCAACGTCQQSCPSCDSGWLVERSGRYGAFLGCIRFPDCRGKSKVAKRAWPRTRLR